MKQIELDETAFRQLMKKEEYADFFAEKHRDYILDYPFEDAYIVALTDGYYRVDYQFHYGLGVFFEGIEKLEEEALQAVLLEYERSFQKVKHIQSQLEKE